jgi:hypothetical protein
MRYRVVGGKAEELPMPKFQTPETDRPDRKDHIWVAVSHEGLRLGWKCILCGARTRSEPPAPGAAGNWCPDTYEPLTPAERELARKLRR